MFTQKLKKKGLPIEAQTWVIQYEDLEFGESIGRGNYGTVFLGTYFMTAVAIKRIEDDSKKYVEREIAILRDVRHPCIVQLIGLCKLTEDDIYVVTEYLERGSLRDVLKDHAIHLPWWLRISFSVQLGRALLYLHTKGIMHRDIKSKNLIVDSRWRLKLCDFGLSRAVIDDRPRRYSTCGTDDWLAPEIALGREYSFPSDVFSFGMVIFELIFRERPNNGAIRHDFLNGVDFARLDDSAPPDMPPDYLETGIGCTLFAPEERLLVREALTELLDLQKLFPEPVAELPGDMPASGAGTPRTPLRGANRSPSASRRHSRMGLTAIPEILLDSPRSTIGTPPPPAPSVPPPETTAPSPPPPPVPATRPPAPLSRRQLGLPPLEKPFVSADVPMPEALPPKMAAFIGSGRSRKTPLTRALASQSVELSSAPASPRGGAASTLSPPPAEGRSSSRESSRRRASARRGSSSYDTADEASSTGLPEGVEATPPLAPSKPPSMRRIASAGDMRHVARLVEQPNNRGSVTFGDLDELPKAETPPTKSKSKRFSLQMFRRNSKQFS